MSKGNRRSALVRVLQVRARGSSGAIFRGQTITEDGQILDAHSEVTVRLRGVGGASVMPGQWWRVTGSVSSRTFVNSGGFEMTEDQMEVAPGQATLRLPSGAHIVDYLARNPRFNGIGRVTAEALWETFKESLFDVLNEGDYQALADAIPPRKARILIQGWQEEGLSGTLQWLQSHGLGLTIGRRVLAYFGSDASEKITENPYRLLSFAAGWSEVDKLACEHLGVAREDSRRLAAAVEEVVYRRFSLGDTCVARSDLEVGLRSVLDSEGTSAAVINAAINQSETERRLLFDQEGNAYSIGASILENQVVDCIKRRLDQFSPACDVNAIIRCYENRQGKDFRLNEKQRDAVHLIADNHISLLTGGAGCGKTTVLKVVCEVLEAQGYDVTQLALAGKAVRRMMQATGRSATTLASFIKRMRERDDGSQAAPTRPMALVIDEASMVDLISFSNATSLVDEDTKIVLVGDPFQLPPVGPGLILHCLASVPGVPHVELSTAKRFGSEIAGLANAIKSGAMPSQDRFNGRVRFIEARPDEMEDLASGFYMERPEDSVVLCATRRVAHLVNVRLQKTLTAANRSVRLFNLELDVWEDAGFRQGDLLLCTKNHWDLGLQNGSLGRLTEVFEEPMLVEGNDDSAGYTSLGWIEWDDGERRPLRESLLDSLELGYALTVHKAQGSQWKQVIVCLPTSDPGASTLVDRSLIYTAITRAEEAAIICGQHGHLTQAVERDMAANRRNVGLSKRLSHALNAATG